MEMNHERYMRQTIALAADVPERPFAALIVDRVTGKVVVPEKPPIPLELRSKSPF